MQSDKRLTLEESNPAEFRIRLATAKDVPALMHYRSRSVYRDSGYAPAGALIERAESGRLWILSLRAQTAGFLNFTMRRDGICHVPQLVVDEEVWRRGYGTIAMNRLISQATTCGCHSLTLKTAVGALANQFWPTIGLQQLGFARGRKRPLIAWGRVLANRANLFGSSAFPPRSTWGEDPRILLPSDPQTLNERK
jgi:GNAT superfamily N-acetyltransferase